MLRISKKMEYGIIALLYLSSQPTRSASTKEISSSCNIPENLLSKIMQVMKNEGFVSASYGNQGGYRLLGTLSQINLLDLTYILDNPIRVVECLETKENKCPIDSNCRLVKPMTALNERIKELFKEISLDSLSQIKVFT